VAVDARFDEQVKALENLRDQIRSLKQALDKLPAQTTTPGAPMKEIDDLKEMLRQLTQQVKGGAVVQKT
jgi:hypothetical protein